MKIKLKLIFLFLFFYFYANITKGVLAPLPATRYCAGIEYIHFDNKFDQITASMCLGRYLLSNLFFGYRHIFEISGGIRAYYEKKPKFCWKACLLDFKDCFARNYFDHAWGYDIILRDINYHLGGTLLSYDKTSCFDTEIKWANLSGFMILNYYYKSFQEIRISQEFEGKIGITSLKLGRENFSDFSNSANKNLFGYEAGFSTNVNFFLDNLIKYEDIMIYPKVELRSIFSTSSIQFIIFSMNTKIKNYIVYKGHYVINFGIEFQKAFLGKIVENNLFLRLGINYYFSEIFLRY